MCPYHLDAPPTPCSNTTYRRGDMEQMPLALKIGLVIIKMIAGLVLGVFFILAMATGRDD